MSKEKNVEKAIEDQKVRVRELRERVSVCDKDLTAKKQARKALGGEISLCIRRAKELRQERNALTAQVKEKKDERQKLNTQILEKIKRIKEVQAQKVQAQSKLGVSENPARVKDELDRLNAKIETEVISFDKEKALMKQIHTLEKKYAQCKEASVVWEEHRVLSKEIRELQQKADQVHRGIQRFAKESQEKHARVVVDSQKIDELQKKEQVLQQEIDEKQKLLDASWAELNVELQKLSELTGVQEDFDKEELRLLHESEHKKLVDLRRVVEEKLQKGEKLTTEDLLVLQSQDGRHGASR